MSFYGKKIGLIEFSNMDIFRREMLLNNGGKSSNQINKKRMRQVMHKPGRIQKKYDIKWGNRSQELFSTSPDSPMHFGAAAIKPIPVVRTNPMYEHMEGLSINDTIEVRISSFFCSFQNLLLI